jgi:hypothetical protein
MTLRIELATVRLAAKRALPTVLTRDRLEVYFREKADRNLLPLVLLSPALFYSCRLSTTISSLSQFWTLSIVLSFI